MSRLTVRIASAHSQAAVDMAHEQEPASTPRPAARLLSAGLWRVVTQSAIYLLDLDAATATRLPSAAATAGWNVAMLRRDGEPLTLLEAPSVVVGERLRLLLTVREDGRSPTVRETTPVRAVDRLR
jgi:hypothetical protein